MSWYSTGTASVRNGSKVVTVVGADFINNLVQPGDAFVPRGGQPNEIGRLISATQLELVNAWGGGDADGLAYSIQPTTDYQRALASRLGGMVGDYQAVLDGPARGMFGDGSTAAPGVRFAADQDTGLRRAGENIVALVAGGGDRLTTSPTQTQSRVPLVVGNSVDPTSITLAVDGAITTATYGIKGGGAGNPSWDWGTGDSSTKWTLGYTYSAARTVQLTVDGAGGFGVGTTTPASFGGYTAMTIGGPQHGFLTLRSPSGQAAIFQTNFGGIGPAIGTSSAHPLLIAVNSGEVARFDQGGNLLVGVTSGNEHTINKAAAQGSIICRISSSTTAAPSVVAVAVASYSPSGTGAAFYLGAHSTTNRSLNATGTVNANGSDWAERMRKARACGIITKGQIAGVGSDGLLIDRWSLAHSFVVKSTDPSFIGGEDYGRHLSQPVEPVYLAPLYNGPDTPAPAMAAPSPLADLPLAPSKPVRAEGESDEDLMARIVAFSVDNAAYIAAVDAAPQRYAEWQAATQAAAEDAARFAVEQEAYEKAQAGYRDQIATAEAAHEAAMEAYASALAAWKADMEAARQTIDIIAFSGQVPCNVEAGTFAPGDYIVAAEGPNDTIVGVAMKAADMSLGDYQRRLGKVWRVMDDGRAWIDVQHG